MSDTPRSSLSLEELIGEIRILWDRIRTLEAANHALKYDRKTNALRGDLSQEEMEKVYAYATKYNMSLTVMIVDLDDFKIAQDTRSHQWGDAVLAETVAEIHASLRTTDLIFRYGAGDEFLILLVNLSPQTAELVRNRLEVVLAEREVTADNYTGKVAATVGMAFGEAEPFAPLIGLADEDLKARKRAKKVGR